MFLTLKRKSKKVYPALLMLVFVFTLFFGLEKSVSSSLNTEQCAVENEVKFVHISDVHFQSNGRDNSRRLFADSDSLLDDAIKQINSDCDIDFVVFSGDVVNKPVKSDLKKFTAVANTLKMPWYVSTGNHDIGIKGGLSKNEFFSVISQFNNNVQTKKSYYEFCPNKKFLVIVLDGVIDNRVTANGYFDKAQLKWLDTMLAQNKDKNVIIFQHYPVVEPFKSKSHNVLNAEEYLSVLDKYKNVLAVFSGHYHATKIRKRNNVLHISTPALVEYPNAFRKVTLKDNGSQITVNLEFIETGLKDLQAKSKSRSKSYQLSYGQEADREACFSFKK